MSSSSNESRYLAVVPGNQTPQCFCPLPSREREAWKPDNPGRRFYNCPKSLISADACNFFRWSDPPLNQHYKDIILGLKRQIAEMNSTAEVDRFQKKLEKQKQLRKSDNNKVVVRIKELEMELNQFKVNQSKVKVKIWVIIVVLCLVVVFLLVKII